MKRTLRPRMKRKVLHTHTHTQRDVEAMCHDIIKWYNKLNEEGRINKTTAVFYNYACVAQETLKLIKDDKLEEAGRQVDFLKKGHVSIQVEINKSK